MKYKITAMVCLLLVNACVVSPTQAPEELASQIQGTPTGTMMTEQYVETVGRMAYLWGWPLVNNYNRAAKVANLPEPGRMGGIIPVSPPGYISMLTDYIDEKENFVTCPNQDTVYGAGYQRLNKTPVIIQVPDFKGRFFTYQVVDARTNAFATIGKQYGTKPGFYLLVGPNWNGAIPEGVNGFFRSSTDLCTVFPRVFQDDTTEDKKAIQPLLSQVMVYPLSEFDGKMKSKDWTKTPKFPAPASAGGETKWVIPEKFFDQLPVLMKEIPPLPGEESLYKTIQSVLDAAAKDPKIKETLQKTAIAAEQELIAPLFHFHNNGRHIGNGWNSPPNGAKWGVDYLSRAATAKSNMYDNAPQETRYIYTDFDSTGARLNGNGSYTVTFPKGQTPPVDGFWSLTLYNKEHLFSANELNRYSLGTKSKSMKFNEDGSLTIYVQSQSPGAGKETNWLPAPQDEFSLYIRAYWPKAQILEEKWTPPQIQKVRSSANPTPEQDSETTPVNFSNFTRAESDLYFDKFAKPAGLGKFTHRREMAAIDQQEVVRMNRDTLYSSAVFDLEASPVTIVFPGSAKRFMSMLILSEDHYVVDVVHDAGRYTYDKEKAGTRYITAIIRTLANPEDPADMKEAHAAQDALRAEQKAVGRWDAPNWDESSRKKIREALVVIGNQDSGNWAKRFGSKDEVDPVAHLIGTAIGWGGNPDSAAMYSGANPKHNDGITPHTLTIKDVPVDGFWSVSVYNAKGYFEKNAQNAYSVNNITAKKAADGSIKIQFGGKPSSDSNYLPISPGWNYTVRLYRPRAELLNGQWKFPEAEELSKP